MDDIEYQSITDKLAEVTALNKKLQKDNKNMIKSIRHYKRVIRGYKQKLESKENNDKQFYRNGQKKGRTRNG